MKRNKLTKCIVPCLVAALITACTQDELADVNTLAEGQYSVKVTSVTIGGEGSEQLWGSDAPQTRMIESPDGNNSVWQWNGEIFYVKFDGDNDRTGEYKLYGAQEIQTVIPLYWRSKTNMEAIIGYFTQPQTVNGGIMDLASQTGSKPAYVCRSETTAKCGQYVNLQFRHQLAQVRVYVQGVGYEGDATGVTINNVPTSCTVTDGVPTATENDAKGSIPMFSTKVNDGACFEANVLPGTLGGDDAFAVTLNGTTYPIDVEKFVVEGGNVYTVNLRLQKNGRTEVDLSQQKNIYKITDGGLYFFYGSNEYGIQVAAGSNTPTIYLANTDINVTDGNAIDIQSGSPTINIQGNVSLKSSNGAGIFVAQNRTVTIRSSGRFDNVLTVEAGGEAAGIGGYATGGSGTACGNITIKDIRLIARGSSANGGACPGIGGAGNGLCGTIKIQDSFVYAYGSTSGNNHAPGIGSAQPAGGESPAAPRCEFSGSNSYFDCQINAHRGGGNADYIGQGGNSGKSGINFGGGWCKLGFFYCYTGDGTFQDFMKAYDGNGTEI